MDSSLESGLSLSDVAITEALLYTGPLPINPIGKKAAGVPTTGEPAKLVRQLKRIGLHAQQMAKGD